ncbi:UDP-2,3-diacylglucosamine diphosphatase [Pedobacter alluvionis]|uniref:UDP-2,3-diacylglucosamine diphosphatase n=1 Tax=Pedobacter alluvionis TaxID=475253 RepID=A0A497XUX8_9SPHI|nr:UDP-2,3-diacylglucosamine diphosphatase [Pedobacter alluvionis]RLJ73386.1 UDP-2,3-diacylglucosamine hydrolase [Pedobacter alluvionis]TFB32970.1 UDP-2,3-diacylglucosamine diphosphatase [Pedobacter alluvionis]
MAKNIYFASDFHLGTPNYAESRAREARIVSWLDFIEPNCGELFLMGDIFDFWFEYSKVIPKGFIRLQGKLAAMADAGIKIYFFKGNHDMWVRDYFIQEIGMEIVSDELIIERGGKKFYLHHGDGLGPGDNKYKFLRKIFRSKLCQWLFARLHPNLGIGIANGWSQGSRAAQTEKEVFLGEDKEWLAIYAKEQLQKAHFDYFIFGHRHLPLDIDLGKGSRYVNIGEWLNYNSYGVFDGVDLKLEYYSPDA